MRYKRSSSTLVFTGYLYPRASPHKRRDTDHKKQDFGACYAHVRSVIYKEGERGGQREREREREGEASMIWASFLRFRGTLPIVLLPEEI